VEHLIEFGQEYGKATRRDYRLFVDAFRNGKLL
jgi:hypothetical protein